MRSMFIALLSCMLFVGVCVAPAMAAEKSEGSGNLLAVRSLDVTPLTDEELDQVVGASDLFVLFILAPIEPVAGLAVAVDFTALISISPLAIRALDVLAAIGPLTIGLTTPPPAPVSPTR